MRGHFVVLAMAFAVTQANQGHSDSEGATMAKDKMMPPMDKMMKEGGGAKESGAQDLERAASASYIHGHPKVRLYKVLRLQGVFKGINPRVALLAYLNAYVG